jgi:serine acetyltransferase
VNTRAVVEHDVKISDGAVIAPAATLCGRVRVGPNATVGAGATVLPDISIGATATVAAGALVREDVPAAMVVAGVPARPITPRE